MKNKLMLLTAASAFSMAGIAADYTNIVLINLDDVGYSLTLWRFIHLMKYSPNHTEMTNDRIRVSKARKEM